MGFADAKGGRTGQVLFSGGREAICRANIHLRSADRVTIKLASFQAEDFGQLYDRTYALNWQDWIPADGAFPVRGRSIASQLSSVPACQKIVKKAIVDKLLAAHGAAELPETGPVYTVEVALLKNVAELTIDTTGAGLNKRGWHTQGGQAPLKETLAAALIDLSFWKPDRPFFDPFCGSGTIAIEAARLARNIAPGVDRSFVAETWPVIDPQLWQQVRTEARAAERPPTGESIMATDIDPREIEIARAHAEAAGVADDIHFQQMDFREISTRKPYGCLISNPPYGQRVGDVDELHAIYAAMPDVFRRLKTWSFYVLTNYGPFEKVLAQPADRRRKLYNGPIECTYYQFHGPRPPKSGQAPPPQQLRVVDPEAPSQQTPAFGGLVEHNIEQAEVFSNRLQKNARHLRRWPKKGITCYRLYDRDIPEVPLVVEKYENYLHISEWERPHERTAAEHADWLELMKSTAAEALEIDPEHVYLKTRKRQKGLEQYEKFGQSGQAILVNEAGLRFEVNLADYLDTGLFLDHRNTRQMVRDKAAGKRFLNLFCYTGSFTVYAAAGGAASTTSVDLSANYIEWARRNLNHNDLAGPGHRFVVADCLDFVTRQAEGQTYDLAVVDPPTFSNSKRLQEDFDIQRDYPRLLRAVLRLMSPGGLIYFSSNFRRLKFDESELPGARVHEISKQTVPEDFRNQRIHRCWAIYREK